MFDFWENEPTEEETGALLRKAAHEVRRRKLAVPAVLALEMHRPLANIGAHTAVALAPFIAPFTGYDLFNNYTRVLANGQNVERLIQLIESESEGELEKDMEDPC